MSNKNNEVKSIFSQFVDLVKSKCCTVNNFNIVVGEKGLNALIDDFRKDNYKFLRDFMEAARRDKANNNNFVTFEGFFNKIDLSKDKFDNLEDQKKFYLNTLSFMHDLMLMLRPDIKHYEWPDVKDRNTMVWVASSNYRKYKLTFSSFFGYPGKGYLIKILDSIPKELSSDENIKAKIKEIADDAVSDKYETKGLGVSSGSWIETESGKRKPDGLDDVTKVFGYHDAHFSLQTYLYLNYGSCFTDENRRDFFNKLKAEVDAMNNGERKGRYPTKDSQYGLPVERYDDCILGKNSIRDIYEVLKDTIDKQKLAKTLAKAMFYFASPEPNGLSEDDFKWYFETFGDDINDKIDINLNVDFDSYMSKYLANSMGPFECFNNFIKLQVSPILLKFIAKIRITGRKNNFRGFDIEHVTEKIVNSKNMFDEIDKLEYKDDLFLALCGLSRDMEKNKFGRLVALFYPIHSKRDDDARRISRILTESDSIIEPSYEKYKQLLENWNYTSAEEFLTELKSKVDETQKEVLQIEKQKRDRKVKEQGEETVKKLEINDNVFYEKEKNADLIKENNHKWLFNKLGEFKTKEFYKIKVTAEMSDYKEKMMLAQRQYLIDNGLNEAEANAFAKCNVDGWEIKDKIIKRVQGMIDQRKQWLTEMFGSKAAEQFSQIKNVEGQRKWLTERIGTYCESSYHGKSAANIELVGGVISGYECYEANDWTSFTGESSNLFKCHIKVLLEATNKRREWLKKILGDEAKTFDELVEVQAQREWLTQKFNTDVASALMDGIFKCKIDEKPLKEIEEQLKLQEQEKEKMKNQLKAQQEEKEKMEEQLKLREQEKEKIKKQLDSRKIGKFDRIMLWLKDNNHNWLYKILESIYNVVFGEKYELTDELIKLIRHEQNMPTDKEQNKLNRDLNQIGSIAINAGMQKENQKVVTKQNEIMPEIEKQRLFFRI